MSQALLRMPIIGGIPFTLHSAVEGVYDLAAGLAKLPCADGGARQLQLGVEKITSSPITLLISLINLSPVRVLIKNSRTISSMSESIARALDKKIAQNSSGFFKRLYVLVGTPSLLIARIADLAIGSIALLFALLTAGMSETLNQEATCHLVSGSRLMRDAVTTVVRLISPSALEFQYKRFNGAWHMEPSLPLLTVPPE